MKNLIPFLVIAVATVLSSCQKQPVACITAEKTSADVGETVSFTNCTVDGYSYEWSFDGQKSTAKDLDITFNSAGTFVVDLRAFSKNGKKTDATSETITVTQPTGSVSFWQSGSPAYNITDVTINGQTASITADQPSGISSCNTSGCANFTLDVGTYSYSAEEQGLFPTTWSGTVTITKNGCTTFELY